MTTQPLFAGMALALAATLLSAPVQAHYLWLEQDKAGGHLYFGEYEEMLRERSPGRLDEMPAPEIRAVGRDGQATPLVATREPGGFAFPRASRDATIVATEGGYAVKDWARAGIGFVKPIFYARLVGATPTQTTQAANTMPLDIVPPRTAGEFRVMFQGAPLAATDVRIIAPNAWTREATSGKDGLVCFPFPWRGQYILHVVHMERKPGTFGGAAYEAVRHRATETLNVPSGAREQTSVSWQASPAH